MIYLRDGQSLRVDTDKRAHLQKNKGFLTHLSHLQNNTQSQKHNALVSFISLFQHLFYKTNKSQNRTVVMLFPNKENKKFKREKNTVVSSLKGESSV